MMKSLSDIAFAELDEIAREAGHRAVAEAHAAGFAVPGMAELRLGPNGTVKRLRIWLYADGSIQIVDSASPDSFMAATVEMAEPDGTWAIRKVRLIGDKVTSTNFDDAASDRKKALTRQA
jgi:hypothetical protein